VELSRERRLSALARQFAPQVGAYLRRRAYPLSNADIDDLVEEVIVILWRRLDDVPEGKELPWMIGVARNVLNNARRVHSRRHAMHSRLTPREVMASAEDFVVANERLRATLTELTPTEREVVLLHYWEGLNTDDLGVALGISQTAAASRLSRATARLRIAFTEHATNDDTDPVDRTWAE
jgi:RNA polymerase sigma factor (sigma-70 family)